MEPLIDAYGRVHTYLRISVTDRCNLRCRYCMPPEGIQWKSRDSILTFEEIEQLTTLFATMGIRKVRITGGEPLVRADIEQLVGRIASVPGIESVAMTTNGVLLEQKLAALKRAGLRQLNISLDTLRRSRFRHLTYRDDYDRVRAGIDAAVAHGFVPLKLNVVVMRGFNDDELLDLVEFVRHRPIQMRFLEFAPYDDNDWNTQKFISYTQMKNTLRQRYVLSPVPNQEPSATAKVYRIEGFVGTVGFITSMSDDFCQGCNRLRLTAEGFFKSCLHHPEEVDLRDPLRSGADDDELERLIRGNLALKPLRHEPMEQLVQIRNRTMIQIGG